VVDPRPIGDEGAIANGVDQALLFAGTVAIGGQAFEHEDGMAIDNIHHAAFDIGQAFPDQRRADMAGRQAGEAELREFVGIRPRTGADAGWCAACLGTRCSAAARLAEATPRGLASRNRICCMRGLSGGQRVPRGE